MDEFHASTMRKIQFWIMVLEVGKFLYVLRSWLSFEYHRGLIICRLYLCVWNRNNGQKDKRKKNHLQILLISFISIIRFSFQYAGRNIPEIITENEKQTILKTVFCFIRKMKNTWNHTKKQDFVGNLRIIIYIKQFRRARIYT